jgi:hypothetical protein
MVAVAVATGGCFSTTVTNSAQPGAAQPTGAASAVLDDKWHSGLFAGIVELSGPYDLKALCPGGWAEVRSRTTIWNVLLSAITLDTYSSQTVTIRCAAAAPS